MKLAALKFHRLVAALMLLSIFFVATHVSVDSDTWWHLRTGQWMVEHRQVMTADPFSMPRLGHPLVDYSWLTQIPMFLVWRAFGFAGINLAVAALVTLALAFVYLQTEGETYLRVLVVLLAALASAGDWVARPHLVTFLFTAVFGYVLSLFRWHHVNRLWLLPPLMVLWVNMHAGFVVGFALLLVTAAGQLANRLFRRDARDAVDRYDVAAPLWTALACLAAVFVNPIGGALVTYPFQILSLHTLGAVEEWMSPNFHLAGTVPFVLLLFLTFAAVGLGRRRLDLTDLALFSGFAYLAFLAARNMALFAVVAAPILSRHASAVTDAKPRHLPRWRRLLAGVDTGPQPLALNCGVLIAAVVATAAVLADAPPLRAGTNEAAIAVTMPATAAEFIRRAHPPGPLFNSYNWGGYLIWRLYPEYKVYIDGRTDLYGDAFLREYLQVIGGGDTWRAVFARNKIRLVVIETQSPLAAALRHESGWIEVYTDRLATVFTARGPD